MTESTDKTVTLRIGGMTCAHCVARVQKALDAVPGVDAAKVDLESGTAEIRVGAGTDAARLIGAIEAAGYSAQAG